MKSATRVIYGTILTRGLYSVNSIRLKSSIMTYSDGLVSCLSQQHSTDTQYRSMTRVAKGF